MAKPSKGFRRERRWFLKRRLWRLLGRIVWKLVVIAPSVDKAVDAVLKIIEWFRR